jgi:hypothetical protein
MTLKEVNWREGKKRVKDLAFRSHIRKNCVSLCNEQATSRPLSGSTKEADLKMAV